MSYISASELANRLEMGEIMGINNKIIPKKQRYNTELDRDIAAMEYRHSFEEMMIDYENRFMHPKCMFRNYNWSAMYEEDKICDDKDYIPNLKINLGKTCTCPNHEHIEE